MTLKERSRARTAIVPEAHTFGQKSFEKKAVKLEMNPWKRRRRKPIRPRSPSICRFGRGTIAGDLELSFSMAEAALAALSSGVDPRLGLGMTGGVSAAVALTSIDIN